MADDVNKFAGLSDEELARRAQAGSSVCFEELARRFQQPLMRFLVKRLGSRFDAEDVLQDAFAKAYQSLHQYRDAWPFRTWIFTIACRQAIDHRRKSRRSENEEYLGDLPGKHETPHQRLAEQETRQNLWDIAREVLSEDQFSAVWLYYVEEMPAGEIARTLGRSWVGIKTTLHRARKRLMPHLAGMTDNATLMKAGEA